MKGVSSTLWPRAFRSWMAATTVWSDGVPPYAGPPSSDETTAAEPRSRPATDHTSGDVSFSAASTHGRTWQWPARRSVPNQLTTSEVERAFGNVSASWSRETSQSVPPASVWVFSGSVRMAPTLRLTGVVA